MDRWMDGWTDRRRLDGNVGLEGCEPKQPNRRINERFERLSGYDGARERSRAKIKDKEKQRVVTIR